ncbi:MAG: hypothetical protein LBD81_01165, partial [Holosporaceae bacterium]|nr:hypothetical protein [Holosporaceae bacterium]
ICNTNGWGKRKDLITQLEKIAEEYTQLRAVKEYLYKSASDGGPEEGKTQPEAKEWINFKGSVSPYIANIGKDDFTKQLWRCILQKLETTGICDENGWCKRERIIRYIDDIVERYTRMEEIKKYINRSETDNGLEEGKIQPEVQEWVNFEESILPFITEDILAEKLDTVSENDEAQIPHDSLQQRSPISENIQTKLFGGESIPTKSVPLDQADKDKLISDIRVRIANYETFLIPIETSGEGFSCGYRAIAANRKLAPNANNSRQEAFNRLKKHLTDKKVKEFMGLEIKNVIAAGGFQSGVAGNTGSIEKNAYEKFLDAAEKTFQKEYRKIVADIDESINSQINDKKYIDKIINIRQKLHVSITPLISSIREAILDQAVSHAIENGVVTNDLADIVPTTPRELINFVDKLGYSSLCQRDYDKLKEEYKKVEDFDAKTYQNQEVVQAYINHIVAKSGIMMQLPDSGEYGVLDALAYLQEKNLIVVGDAYDKRAPYGKILHMYYHKDATETIYILFHPGHFQRAARSDQ